MNLQLPTSQQAIWSDLRQMAALAGITLGATNTVGGWKGIAYAIGGIVLLVVEHYVADPSTGVGTPAAGLK